MAKPTGMTNFSGEVSGVVHVRSSAYGDHTRSKPKVSSSKKAQEGFKVQNSRTPAIVNLASQVRAVAKRYGKKFCPGSFYTGMMELLRIPQSTERILMLDALRKYEVNKAYPFSRYWWQPKIEIMPLEDSLTVRLKLEEHAEYHTDFNCYYLQIVVMIWNTENEEYVDEGKMTSWISEKDELPLGCEFVFAKPENASDYLVMCHVVTGINRHSFLFFPDQGMKVVEAGSFSAASLKVRADHEAAKKQAAADNEAEFARPEVEAERVEMRRV